MDPDSGLNLNEDPTAGEEAVPNWRPGLSIGARVENRNAIAQGINKNPYMKEIRVTMAFATAKMVEDGCYMEAANELDYLTRISDYIERIRRTTNLLQGALVDLASQMGHQDNSQLFSDVNTVKAKDLSEEPLREAFNLHRWQLLEVASRFEAPVRTKLLASLAKPLVQLSLQLLSGGNTILPPQQQRPLAGTLSIGNATLPPQQQPQQQQSGPLGG